MLRSMLFSGRPKRIGAPLAIIPLLLSMTIILPISQSAQSGDSVRHFGYGARTMTAFDIAPFALPNTPPGVVRFEEARDVNHVLLKFKGGMPEVVGLSYLQRTWPKHRAEERDAEKDPFRLGWIAQDDWFNTEWREAKIDVRLQEDGLVRIDFKGLSTEFPDVEDYDVTFRRTQGIRVEVDDPESIENVKVLTNSRPAFSSLRVESEKELAAGTGSIDLSGYNLEVVGVTALQGVRASKQSVEAIGGSPSMFLVDILHMTPAHNYSGDGGLLTFHLESDAFTISLESLNKIGPIWAEDFGFFITRADDPTSLDGYRAKNANTQTLNQRVLEHPEQSYAGAFYGQPHPHTDGYHVGCKHARQRFRLQVNGDIVLHKKNVTWVPGKDTDRFKSEKDARFFFGLEDWLTTSRFPDPDPVLVYNHQARRGDLTLEQKTLAVPLLTSIEEGEWEGDDPMVALVRFRFQNRGENPLRASLPIRYSPSCGHTGFTIPQAELDELTVSENKVTSEHEGTPILRCSLDTQMGVEITREGLVVSKDLEPGEACDLVVRIPHISLESPEELEALDALDFDNCYEQVTRYWRREARRGARIVTPDPQLEALHASHLVHVLVADFSMPDDRNLVNTSVGTSTYGNYSNESCMIVDELEGRGLHDEARKRLELWVKYQGTVPQPGNFTDYEGMYYGAGGFECGHYNQHHGWVLWALSRHYFFTRDKEWFESVVDSVLQGADWVFRQRKNTAEKLPHSRGWERGFLPAGSLEDVTDFYYWLSTNSLTWRGTEWAARALEAVGHPEASRVRAEADAYKKDLIKGFETMRQHTPLVRLRDGRWVPNYPSRLYRRGRETGWIRETLEGSVYLLLSGLYDSNTKEAGWILDDFQDNRYVSPPFGYLIPEFERNWYACGGLSMQPNLLAGLLPHLYRDEPEIYIWMFYNAWVSCYREELNGMIEHPAPVLGFTNHALIKTSDEANAVSWLRQMFVFASDRLLHLGRAIPRAWFAGSKPFEATGVATIHGKADVRYTPLSGNKISATVRLDLFENPETVLIRFRHPQGQGIKSAKVNSADHPVAKPATGDIEITGLSGTIEVVAEF